MVLASETCGTHWVVIISPLAVVIDISVILFPA
jgi:hypothetical protein